MFNYVLGAQSLWKEFGNPLRWKIGQHYALVCLFVNGELMDMNVQSDQIDKFAFNSTHPQFFQERHGVSFNDGDVKTLYEITEDMMINFFHSLVENPDRKVFRMRFDTSHRNHSFRISIENAEGDIFCETNQKLFWNAVH